MGPSQQHPSRRRKSAGPSIGRHHSEGRRLPVLQQRAGLAQVSLFEAFGCCSRNRVRAVHDRSGSQGGCGAEALPHAAQPARELGTPVDGSQAKGEQAHAKWARQEDSGAALGRERSDPSRAAARDWPCTQLIRRLRLLNSGNVCYLKAWMLSCLCIHGILHRPLAHRSMQTFWSRLTHGIDAGFELLGETALRSVLSGWEHSNRQHDIVEFHMHAMNRLCTNTFFCGKWQARIQTPLGLEIRDTCITFPALALPMTGAGEMLLNMGLISDSR